MNNLDWHLIHTFLAVARAGSLSAAARVLGVSQPTVSRDIQAIEKATNLSLFKRTTQGLNLTNDGRSLIHAASKMESAAGQFARQATGMSTELTGEVRISVNEVVGIYLLPPAIAAFGQAHPEVEIEIVISNRASSLNKREADLALRMFRPTQPDLVVSRLEDIELGFYATQAYIDEHGIPDSLESFKQATLIGYDSDTEMVDKAQEMGFDLRREDFNIRTDNLPMQINLGRSGAGILGTHVRLASHYPELVRILEWIPLPSLEFWIVCHSDVKFNPRIRALSHFLHDWFSQQPYQQAIL